MFQLPLFAFHPGSRVVNHFPSRITFQSSLSFSDKDLYHYPLGYYKYSHIVLPLLLMVVLWIWDKTTSIISHGATINGRFKN